MRPVDAELKTQNVFRRPIGLVSSRVGTERLTDLLARLGLMQRREKKGKMKEKGKRKKRTKGAKSEVKKDELYKKSKKCFRDEKRVQGAIKR